MTYTLICIIMHMQYPFFMNNKHLQRNQKVIQIN